MSKSSASPGEPIATGLAAIREARGMSQAALAERVELSTEFISRIERGKTLPSLPTLMRFCEALGCTPNDLLLPSSTAVEPLVRLEHRLRMATPEIRDRAVWVAEAVLDYSKSAPIDGR